MTGAGWKVEASSLLRRIDPDAGPLYLMDFLDTDTPEGGALGCTSILFDLQLRDKLKARGEWQGRGFVCLIDANRIEAQFHKIGIGSDARRRVLGIAIHEYAHFLAHKALMTEDRADQILAGCPSLHEYIRNAPITVGHDDPTATPWHDHDGQRFGRACIHLWYRANSHGADFAINDVWSSAYSYRLAGPAEYVQALGAEPRERQDEPLRSIVASPLPARFAEFCNLDIERARAQLARDSNANISQERETHEHRA